MFDRLKEALKKKKHTFAAKKLTKSMRQVSEAVQGQKEEHQSNLEQGSKVIEDLKSGIKENEKDIHGIESNFGGVFSEEEQFRLTDEKKRENKEAQEQVLTQETDNSIGEHKKTDVDKLAEGLDDCGVIDDSEARKSLVTQASGGLDPATIFELSEGGKNIDQGVHVAHKAGETADALEHQLEHMPRANPEEVSKKKKILEESRKDVINGIKIKPEPYEN